MTDPEISPADAAVRRRITEWSVHIPCGGIRGPLGRLWQSCRDEDAPQRWEGCDVSREVDLCTVCYRGTAGGVSRWSWHACEDCRAVNDSVGSRWGARPLALGRHSIMNGIAVRGGQPREVQDAQIERLAEFARGDFTLEEWRRSEYRRLAAAFDPLADVPLRTWQETFPPGRAASLDAFDRLLNGRA